MSRELERMRRKSAENVAAVQKTAADLSARWDHNMGQIVEGQERATEVYRNAAVIIEDIDRDFKRATKLDDTDVAFLFLATGLQCVRQYVLTKAPERLNDQEAAKLSGKSEEHSDRHHRYYNPTKDQIILNPVPFDAIYGAKESGALRGGGALGHRGATPGHDPVLGLIFGTANIATSTLTNWHKESFHITTQGKRDVFANRAKTSLVASHTMDKLFHQGMKGKILIGLSLKKEIEHLRSDLYSKNSLPLPFVSAISPELAGDLAKRGLDMASAVTFGKQMSYAMAIDALIGMTHGLFYDPAQDGARRLYEVRTRRVLLYSNLMASASNVVVTAVSAAVGDAKDASRLLDLGGFANTVRRLIIDTKFIRDVKRDFLKNELYDRIVGDEYDFMAEKKALPDTGEAVPVGTEQS